MIYYSDIYKTLKIYTKQICKYFLHIIQPTVSFIYSQFNKLTDEVMYNGLKC
jgi:hypothetical protein